MKHLKNFKIYEGYDRTGFLQISLLHKNDISEIFENHLNRQPKEEDYVKISNMFADFISEKLNFNDMDGMFDEFMSKYKDEFKDSSELDRESVEEFFESRKLK